MEIVYVLYQSFSFLLVRLGIFVSLVMEKVGNDCHLFSKRDNSSVLVHGMRAKYLHGNFVVATHLRDSYFWVAFILALIFKLLHFSLCQTF